MKSKLNLAAVIAALALCSAAYATQPTQNPCGNSGNNCNVGGSGGNGGNGGAGGQGGSSTAIAGAVAGAAANASNKTDVRNTNSNLNVQGQQQGQSQSSTSSVKNSGNSASVSGAYSGGNTQSNTGNNARTDVTVGGDTVTYAAQERAPVATAYAAPLTASNGTCMGSTSGGAQAAGWGVSIGGTWTDGNCDIRYDAEALRAAGLPAAAQARLCQKEEIAKAMEAAGTPCPGTKKAASAAAPAVTSAPVVQPQYTDPIVRSRLGLPPLK